MFLSNNISFNGKVYLRKSSFRSSFPTQKKRIETHSHNNENFKEQNISVFVWLIIVFLAVVVYGIENDWSEMPATDNGVR